MTYCSSCGAYEYPEAGHLAQGSSAQGSDFTTFVRNQAQTYAPANKMTESQLHALIEKLALNGFSTVVCTLVLFLAVAENEGRLKHGKFSFVTEDNLSKWRAFCKGCSRMHANLDSQSKINANVQNILDLFGIPTIVMPRGRNLHYATKASFNVKVIVDDFHVELYFDGSLLGASLDGNLNHGQSQSQHAVLTRGVVVKVLGRDTHFEYEPV